MDWRSWDRSTARTYVAASFGWSGVVLMVGGFITMFFDQPMGNKVFSAGVGSAMLALKIDRKH